MILLGHVLFGVPMRILGGFAGCREDGWADGGAG